MVSNWKVAFVGANPVPHLDDSKYLLQVTSTAILSTFDLGSSEFVLSLISLPSQWTTKGGFSLFVPNTMLS